MILTSYVEKYGEKGTKVNEKACRAYKNLLLPGLAVYASPENIKKYLIDSANQEKTYSSLYAPYTLKYLSKVTVPINMNLENPWVIEKWHIRSNFRRMNLHGICVTDESITMPEKPISGPNFEIENKEFYVTITINKTESVKVRCRLHHFHRDKDKEAPRPENYRSLPAEAIFPEDQEILDQMPKMKKYALDEVVYYS